MCNRLLLFLVLLAAVLSASAQVSKSDTVDVFHYDLRLNMVHLSHKSIKGEARLSMIPKLPQVSSFSLDLLGLDVDSMSFNGQSCTYLHNDTILRIFPPAPWLQQDTAELVVWYSGQPTVESYGWGGFHFANDSSLAYNLGIAFYDDPHNYGRVWFPCIDEFRARATYEYRIRVKYPFDAVCSGILAGIQDHGDNTRTFHWVLEHKIPSYLASVAISDYSKPGFSVTGLQGGIPADFYVRPQDSVAALNSMVNLPNMVQGFEDCFGPYRWPRIGFVGTTLGAMEHACNIATPAYMFNGNTTYEWLFAHELSHQWFGNLVTCASAADMWLNEGWAVFSESIFMEWKYGWQAYKDYARANHEQVLQYAHTPQGDGSYLALYGIPHQYTYGKTVYDKGASVVHSLRGYLGDMLFFAAIKAYLNQFAFSHASTYDLRDFLSTYTGINMGPWFDAWVFTPGFIDFRMDSFKVNTITPQQHEVEVFVSQHLKGPAQYAGNHRIELLFLDDDWNGYTVMMEMHGQRDSSVFLLPFRPSVVMLDPDEKVMDGSTDNYKVLKQVGLTEFLNTKCTLNVVQVQDSAFVRIIHHWVAPEPFATPIAGLRLSTSRYWSVEGIFPAGFNAEGRFQYSRSNYLDDDILVSTQDSLIMLYRPGPGSEWSPVSFTRMGTAFNGRLAVPNLKPGDYALAVWDKAYLGMDLYPMDAKEAHLLAYPNPSRDSFVLVSDYDGYLSIWNARGQLIFYQWVDAGQQLTWTAPRRGTYHAVVHSKLGVRGKAKLVFTR